MPCGHSLPQINLGVQGGIQGDSHRVFSRDLVSEYVSDLPKSTASKSDNVSCGSKQAHARENIIQLNDKMGVETS
ncbi:hypothetical protein TNCV_406841 [Trichonephila clavipes]|nr:hypothetical protein TNCV_406841 [Trichonephila clavipes]